MLRILTGRSTTHMHEVWHSEKNGRTYSIMKDGIRQFARNDRTNSVQSVVMPPGMRTGFYYDQIADACKGRSVLVLGHGAGAVANVLNGRLRYVGVEPDPMMRRMGQILHTDARGEIVSDLDAMTFLERTTLMFDNVVVDTYDGQEPCADFAAIEKAAIAHVTDGGRLIVNRYTPAGGNVIDVKTVTAV